MEMALQDAMRVCNPDVNTPFQSIEDAVNRLHMARRCLVSTDHTMTRGPHLLIPRLCMQVVEKLMEGTQCLLTSST
ncbi:uncharacterized protein [Zea mays]|uniref:GLTSCR protein conserved domain-containing protein n=1 Tax=Zea mays TaxID=4577 RepID=B4FV01_MAIZE|nr:uncharacterized protein LOC100278828 [Zea mays]ACF85944.1 unknown [Zea mays]ACG47678.1 hypothetical protein [Zea mays]|eukprot:XP_008674834.1 uncharacterized protein LOC100278828 [Zea mays]